MNNNGVKYVSNSANSKLCDYEPIDATYVSTNSCPLTCKLKGTGCYSELSFVGIITKRLNKTNSNAVQLAKAEASAIDNSYEGKKVPKGRLLRLHVSGDCRTITGVKIVNAAIKRWKQRGGGEVYSYTHAWDKILREYWNEVSMLASVDSIEEVEYARQNGYAPAIVVAEHKSDKSYKLDGSDVRWIPCPSQTRNVKCVNCKLCINADKLFDRNYGIAFSAHGVRKNMIKKRLNVIQ
jgi:hypothetical protein